MTTVVCSAVIKRGDSFLMVKEYKQIARGKWGLPGGKLEDAESIIAGLHREVQEETGLTVVSENLIAVINKPVTHEGQSVVKFIFQCEVAKDQTTAAEHEFDYLSLSKLDDLAKQGLVRGKEIVSLLTKISDGHDHGHTDVLQII